jgi:hypothetical protein
MTRRFGIAGGLSGPTTQSCSKSGRLLAGFDGFPLSHALARRMSSARDRRHSWGNTADPPCGRAGKGRRLYGYIDSLHVILPRSEVSKWRPKMP